MLIPVALGRQVLRKNLQRKKVGGIMDNTFALAYILRVYEGNHDTQRVSWSEQLNKGIKIEKRN